ncbi:MAG: arginine--tRNA ligase [Bacteroidales bacterium]
MRKSLKKATAKAVKDIYGATVPPGIIQVQRTKSEFSADLTIVVFPLVKYSRKKPENTANDIGVYLKNVFPEISSYHVIKGFLNLSFSSEFWLQQLNSHSHAIQKALVPENKIKIMIEYSSPNTNKPLHLGHIRNNLIGDAMSRIMKANGHDVIRVNLINDRGIHICKSMQAYLDFDPDGSPEKSGLKGDKYVGELYVKFENTYKSEIDKLKKEGLSEEEAKKQAPSMQNARALLKKWEEGDVEVVALWEKMNNWVYKGFDTTYQRMGIEFDQVNYESETYKKGRSIVLKGLEDGIFYEKDDHSVWADLRDEGLDEKILIRSDGTSVYMTQDIGTAVERFEKYNPDKHIYVVGNEQNYHFQVLKILLKKLGYDWADKIEHMSYGMVELPEGKMKSREGKVVDADDLMYKMFQTSKAMSLELGKLGDLTDEQKNEVYETIAMGALKYFILKIDPRKNMVFNPEESVDFNGHTGPFIQYTYARICSVVRKAAGMNIRVPNLISEDIRANDRELELIKHMYQYNMVLKDAADEMDPGLVANYAFELAKEFNQYYHEYSILKAENGNLLQFRLMLAHHIGETLKLMMSYLGIQMPEKM